MPAGQCWQTTDPLNLKHQKQLKETFPADIERLFWDNADIPKKPENMTWPDFIRMFVNNAQDGMRYWQNDEKQDHHLLGVPGEGSMKNHLLMCKAIGAIPLLDFGHAEERDSWLTRNPVNHCDFMEQFFKYLAFYLRNEMNFQQAHLGIINEPKKIIGVKDYAKICKAWKKGFCQYPNFKVHIGNNDIEQDLDGYIQGLLADQELALMMKGSYYATHVLWPRQHNQGYIKKVNELLAGTGIKQSVIEFSPNGDWGKYGEENDWGAFNELRDNGIEIWNLLFFYRSEFFGDVFDEGKVFTKNARPDMNPPLKAGDWLPNGYNQKKVKALKKFTDKYYNKQLPVESEGIMLEQFYYRLKVTFNRDPKRVGVKFLQDCLGLVTDGDFGKKTESALEAYQISKGLVRPDGTADKIAGPATFKALIAEFPRLWAEMDYKIAIGEW